MGKIPRDLFEDELVPLFEKAGPIWDLRLMMEPLSGLNRGYAFITFCTKEAAQEAVKLVSVHANLGFKLLMGFKGQSRVLTAVSRPECCSYCCSLGLLFSVTITRSVPASRLAFAYPWPTTASL